jgi:hypothetical protein
LDKFCRRCGARRRVTPIETEMQATALLAPTCGLDELSPYATALLQTSDVCHAVSATLVKSVTGSLTARQTRWLKGRWSKSLMLALISLPVWLMIVLLSPLDAYVAIRSMAE